MREQVISGEALDLSLLPQIFYTEDQTAPYLTAAMIAARDPDSGAHNLSFHRLMIDGSRTAAIYMTPDGHLDQIWRKNSAKGRATEIAAVIGTHPVWCYASLSGGALEQDDYATLGSVLGAPLQVAAGLRDTSLLVPARAEIVLEGHISESRETAEGPFGEFLGFVAKLAPRPVVEFSSMSMRRAPVFQDIVAGQIEHLTLSSFSLRARLERRLLSGNPGITGIFLPAPMTLFISVDKSRQPDFDPAQIMRAVLTEEKFMKQIICFDHDVNPRKQASVQHAIACHVQADRDVVVLSDQKGNGIDPSEVNGKTTKIGINAMAKRTSVRNQLPQDVLDSIDLKDWLT